MVNRNHKLILDINGIKVLEEIVDYGIKYTFLDGDNKVTLGLTEFSFDEFYSYSKEFGSFKEYDIMKSYEVRTITGFDWEIEFGKDRPNVKRFFKVFEILGKRYAKLFKPDIIYYSYEDERIHRSDKRWIMEGGYELVHEGNLEEDKVAIYYKDHKEKNDEI